MITIHIFYYSYFIKEYRFIYSIIMSKLLNKFLDIHENWFE